MVLAYHLYFNSPLHVGIESIGQEKVEHIIRSDTLWGAIISRWLLLFNDDPDELCLNPGFTISSCFPLIHGRRFFPVPIGALDHLMNEVADMPAGEEPTVKTLKKVRFLSDVLFEKWRSGGELDIKDLGPGSVYPWEASFKDNNSASLVRFASEAQRPRIRLDQATGGVGEDAFFYCTDLFFHKNAGLFFLAQFQDDSIRKKFESALMLLGDSGIGADRTIGKGFFTFEPFKFKTSIENGNMYVLLSLCIPEGTEVEKGLLNSRKSYYGLVRRFGRAGDFGVNRLRRPDTWMLVEGSIFPFRPLGKIEKILEGMALSIHTVYRNGKAFSLPFNS